MKPHHFAALAVASVVSLLVALVAYTAQTERSSATPSGAKLFTGLEKSAADIARIEIAQGSGSLTLERKGDLWTIKEKDGFPASQEKVRALIVGLTEAELAEAKTKNEQHYRILELEDPKGENANSHLVRLLDANGGSLAELVVGKKRQDAFGTGRAGSYVRRPDEAQTWLITRELDPTLRVKGWVRDRLFEVTPEKIKTAEIEVPGEAPYGIERDADGRTFKLSKIPAGKKIKYMNSVDDIVDTMSSYNIDEVRRSGAAPAAAAAKTGRMKLETDQGLKVEFTVSKENEFAWMSLKATGEGEGKAAAEELNALAGGWEFRIPTAQFDRIFKTFADLIEDVPA